MKYRSGYMSKAKSCFTMFVDERRADLAFLWRDIGGFVARSGAINDVTRAKVVPVVAERLTGLEP